jgi:hypothetical protein
MPDTVTTLCVGTVEVDHVLCVAGQALVDMDLAVFCIHDAEAIAVLFVHILDELIGEGGGSGLIN